MSLLKAMMFAFQIPPGPPVHGEKERKTSEREAVMRCARNSGGNLSLQFGRYITREDIKKRKEDLRSYDFMSGDNY